jgi:hypothetical protein
MELKNTVAVLLIFNCTAYGGDTFPVSLDAIVALDQNIVKDTGSIKNRILQAIMNLNGMNLDGMPQFTIMQLKHAADCLANKHIVGKLDERTVGIQWDRQTITGNFLAVSGDWNKRFDIVYDLLSEATVGAVVPPTLINRGSRAVNQAGRRGISQTVYEFDERLDVMELQITFQSNYYIFGIATEVNGRERITRAQNPRRVQGIAIRYERGTCNVITCFPI